MALTSFIGRRHELGEARSLLAGSRLLTLTGMGGVGKTRLSLQLAASVQRAFPDGVWLVELSGLTEPKMLPFTVAAALGLSDESASPASRLAEHLTEKRLLIVLDNCEHLPDACAELVNKLLPLAPGVKVVATSRHRLGIEGEQLMHVKPFAVPASATATGEGYEAVQLFVERARATAPGFDLTDDNRGAVLDICRTLDGVPLAIELAAAWAGTLTPAEILARLGDRFALLTRGGHAPQAHHRTLQATIDWSHALCSPEERALWERLSVFAGGFDLRAAEEVCSSADIQPRDVLDLVAGLLDKSVVTRMDDTHGRQARFRMLDTIRSYGLSHLAASGLERVLRGRHRDFYRDLILRYEAECFGPHQLKWLLLLRREHANLRAAIEYCLATGDGRSALELAGPTYYWIASGSLREGLTWLDRALTRDTEASAVRAKALWVRSYLAVLLGDRESPEDMLTECRDLAERLDKANVFYPKIWQVSGLAAFLRGDLDRSREPFERALDGHLRAGPGHLHCAFDCMFQLALIALQGDDAAAGDLVQRCLGFCEEHQASWSKAYALWLRGVHRLQSGDPDAGISVLEESIRLLRPVDDCTGLAYCIEAIAWCEAGKERWARAATALGAAHAVWRKTGALTTDVAMHRYAHDTVERAVVASLGEDAYRTTYSEGTRFSPEEAVAFVLRKHPKRRAATPSSKEPSVLTPRESEIAALVAEGQTNRDIASTLVISPRTAEAHVEHILAKLGFSSRTQIAAWIAEHQPREHVAAPRRH